jgi:hypothetical protein
MPTYPIDLPTTPKFKAIRYRQHGINSVTRSIFSGATQVYTWGAGWWEADCVLPPMSRANADYWAGTLLALNGQQGTFNLIDPVGGTPRIPVTGAPAVWHSTGGSYTGNAMNLSGFTPSAQVITPNTWFTIQNVPGLYKTIGPAFVNSDGNGRCSIEFWPPLRGTAFNGYPLQFNNPAGIFRLASNDFDSQWDEGKLMMGLSFQAIEAF